MRCKPDALRRCTARASVTITLNGDRTSSGPLTVSDLLARLDIDARRVAVEHNLDRAEARALRRHAGRAKAIRSRS